MGTLEHGECCCGYMHGKCCRVPPFLLSNTGGSYCKGVGHPQLHSCSPRSEDELVLAHLPFWAKAWPSPDQSCGWQHLRP
eukprot:3997597-Amphidinium_carterae.1